MEQEGGKQGKQQIKHENRLDASWAESEKPRVEEDARERLIDHPSSLFIASIFRVMTKMPAWWLLAASQLEDIVYD